MGGHIDYKHNGTTTQQATVYKNAYESVVCRATHSKEGWTLDPKNCPNKDLILQALGSHQIYY